MTLYSADSNCKTSYR